VRTPYAISVNLFRDATIWCFIYPVGGGSIGFSEILYKSAVLHGSAWWKTAVFTFLQRSSVVFLSSLHGSWGSTVNLCMSNFILTRSKHHTPASWSYQTSVNCCNFVMRNLSPCLVGYLAWSVFMIHLEVFTPAVCNMCIYEGLNIVEKDVLTESLCTKSVLLFRQYERKYD